MLWKIYKSDPEVCHYILGTMHTSTKEAYTFAELAKKYISATSIYAGEMDLNQTIDVNLSPFFMLEKGVVFSSFFRPKQYQKYRKIVFKSFGYDLHSLENYTPFYISNFLVNLHLKKEHNEPLDHFLWNFARENGKATYGIESLKDQIKILENIPLNYQLKTFKDHLKNVSAMKKKIYQLNQMYEQCNLKALMESTKKSMGPIRKLMIYDRNESMSKSIVTLFDIQPSFIAVGAAHIPGKKGILSYLKKEGYKSKKIKL